MEKYSRGRRGAPAKGVGRVTGARVQIPPFPPKKDKQIIAYPFLLSKLDLNLSAEARGQGARLLPVAEERSASWGNNTVVASRELRSKTDVITRFVEQKIPPFPP